MTYNFSITELIIFILFLLPITLLNYYKKSSKITFFVNILFLIQGLSFTLLANKFSWYYGAFFSLYCGSKIISFFKTEASPISQSLFLNRLTFRGKFVPYFPFVGFFVLIVTFYADKYFFSGDFGSRDQLLILTSLFWIIYPYINTEYDRIRDFAFLFLNILVFSLVFPILVEYLIYGESSSGDLTTIVSFLLVSPLVKILNLIGIFAFAEGRTIGFPDQTSGIIMYVWIADMCSGIYSMLVFIAAFIAFVLNEFKIIDAFVFTFLLLGILVSYISNLIRITTIIVVGHFYGGEALYWTHENIGWVIFLFWIALFWWFLERQIPRSYLVDSDNKA